MALQKYSYELTDTFGGEANYSWVKRGEILAKDLNHAFRLARKELGYSGYRGELERWSNDDGRWVPRNICQVLFVNFHDA